MSSQACAILVIQVLAAHHHLSGAGMTQSETRILLVADSHRHILQAGCAGLQGVGQQTNTIQKCKQLLLRCCKERRIVVLTTEHVIMCAAAVTNWKANFSIVHTLSSKI